MGRKMYGYFKTQTSKIALEKTWTWLRNGDFNKGGESLLIAAQNNAIRTNYIKAKIDNTQQNNKCKLRGERDETVNHIIIDCSKLVQKSTRLGTTC